MREGAAFGGRSPWGPRDRGDGPGPGGGRGARPEVTRELVEEIAVLGVSRRDGSTRELNLISYNGGAAKFDVRVWFRDVETGEKRPGKGLTLTRDEARALRDALAGRADI